MDNPITEPSAIATLSVFAADDNNDDLVLLQEALSSIAPECRFDSVENGRQALDYLLGLGRNDAELPDLALFDLNMPLLTGIEVIERLRYRFSHSELPAVLFTSGDILEETAAAYQKGANLVLRKPNDFQELRDLVASVIAFYQTFR